MNPTTLPDISAGDAQLLRAPPPSLVLVLGWSADEADRMGEVGMPPPGDPGEVVVWGRADAGATAERRLAMQKQRPGRVASARELTSQRLSRAQLEIRVVHRGSAAAAGQGSFATRALAITNVGRAAVLHNGEEKASFEATAGDVIEVGRQIVLFCTVRPAWLAGPVLEDAFPFGGADRHGIVGESPAAWELRRRIAFIGSREGHVLVRGESGTGKELVARALHACSSRAAKALVARNAATLPEGIADAELFGNLKSYPNPGAAERPGLVGEADGSTLFLDEIAEISTSLQSHLLRVLDSGEYHRLGEARARTSDLRLIGATNRPDSALKHDLLARLLFRVEVPTLNERREDIPLLMMHLLRQIAAKNPDIEARFFAGGVPRVSPSFMRALLQHPFSTHVRELASLVWRALAESPGDRIETPAGMGDRGASTAETAPAPSVPVPSLPVASLPVASLPVTGGPAPGEPSERDGAALAPSAIQACLDAHNGVIEDAWQPLGLSSRHALARLIKKHGLEIRKKRK